jgi:hypothetical protein
VGSLFSGDERLCIVTHSFRKDNPAMIMDPWSGLPGKTKHFNRPNNKPLKVKDNV